MRQYLLAICMLLFFVSSLFARPQRRAVEMDTIVHAPMQTMMRAVDRFYYQFQNNLIDSLNQWAYMGIAEQEQQGGDAKPSKESRSAIQLVYTDQLYDAANRTGDMVIDIYVLGMRWWKDQHLGTQCMTTYPSHVTEPITQHMTATYSGSILEGGDVAFVLKPIDGQTTRVHYEFSLTFGRVLSAFISDKIWRNAIKWRFVLILQNLVEYAETGTVQPKQQ